MTTTVNKGKKKLPFNGKHGRQHKLTDRQAAFVAEYAVHKCATRAAIDAGVPELSAAAKACQWLTLPQYAHVRAEVDRVLAQRALECDVEAKRLVALLLEVATFNPKSIVDPRTGEPLPLHKLPSSAARAMAEYEVVTEKVPIGKPKKGQKQRFKRKRYLVPTKQWNKIAAIKQIAELCGLEAPKKVHGIVGHFDFDALWRAAEQPRDEVKDRVAKLLTVENAPGNGNGDGNANGGVPGAESNGNGVAPNNQ